MLEAARRAAALYTGRIHSLPILALMVHSACNCRCVMCDIWKANADKREISLADLERHLVAIRALRVERVMLTGGEPLLHSNLWKLCDRLQEHGIRVTLVTTALLLERHAASVARVIDEVVVSIDGARAVHDRVRRVTGAFDRIAQGITAVRRQPQQPRLIARSVLQKANFRSLAETIEAVQSLQVDRLSFLAADVTSTAFNRRVPWDERTQAEIALGRDELSTFAAVIMDAERRCAAAFANGFVEGGAASLYRIHEHYAALAGLCKWPRVRCNAPWISAVLESDGRVRPCFFQPAYETAAEGLANSINSPQAVSFRRDLDVRRNEICQRCVCSLSLPLTARV